MSWITDSHRWQHLVGGIVIGLLSIGCWYTALLAGVGIASALEFKDKSWGGRWDWIDWIMTIAGVAGGFGIVFTIKTFLL
jgi:hypothetical protein